MFATEHALDSSCMCSRGPFGVLMSSLAHMQVSFHVDENRVLSVIARDLNTNRQYQWLENGRMMVQTLSNTVQEVHGDGDAQQFTMYPAAGAGIIA